MSIGNNLKCVTVCILSWKWKIVMVMDGKILQKFAAGASATRRRAGSPAAGPARCQAASAKLLQNFAKVCKSL